VPRIRDYSSPQLNQGEQGVDPVHTAGFAGQEFQARQDLAQTTQGVIGKIEQRQSQEEVSDLNSKFADARDEWTQRIQEQTIQGTVDVDKINTDYQEYVNKLNQNISTSTGRQFFDRQASRLKGQVLKSAGRAQAQLAGERAKENWLNGLNKNANSLQSDPEGFQDTYESTVEALQAKVDSGGLPALAAEKLRAQAGEDLAKAAIRGWARLSPELAQKRLDRGDFDAYLKGDQKAQMQTYIDARAGALETEGKRLTASEEKARKAKAEVWMQKALPEMVRGQLSTTEILDSKDLDFDEKVKMMRLSKQAVEPTGQLDPKVYTDLIERVVLPDEDPRKIRSMTDLAPFVGHGINIAKAAEINKFMKLLPENENQRINEKNLIDQAKGALIDKSPMGQILGTDQLGHENFARFMNDVQHTKDEWAKQNKPMSELYNPDSPNYLGNLIKKHRLTPEQVVSQKAKIASELTAKEAARKKTGEEMVRVVDENGVPGKIPASQIDAAIKSGKFRKAK
jgi:hypothetical protein